MPLLTQKTNISLNKPTVRRIRRLESWPGEPYDPIINRLLDSLKEVKK